MVDTELCSLMTKVPDASPEPLGAARTVPEPRTTVAECSIIVPDAGVPPGGPAELGVLPALVKERFCVDAIESDPGPPPAARWAIHSCDRCIRCMMGAGGVFDALRTNLWLSSCFAVGRFLGSFWRQLAQKSCIGRLHRSFPARCGGGSRLIMKITRMGWTAHRGGTCSAISIAEMPSDHTSTFPSYLLSWMTSGAIQCGVPTNVFLLDSVAVSRAATPKSASFTSPELVSRMLPHLTSRWTLPIECR
mmetsp:Transcript_12002/g.28467  ORF Transcript_12002/g.28467 Transcript_12002/m.28467 type:complete len:248 (-) Transcript_12002:713-1456(-)